MSARRPRFARWAIVLAGLAASPSVCRAEDPSARVEDGREVSSPPLSGAATVASWRIEAERWFERGVLEETRGDISRARRCYGRVLKLFIDKADDRAMLDARSHIAQLLTPETGSDSLAGPESSSSELAEAGSPESVSTRTYVLSVNREDPEVRKYVALYTGPLRERTQAAFDRMGRYQTMVSQAILEEGLPRELVYLPVVESEYQPFAVSRAGAVGMWQFMGPTAKHAGLKINYWIDERRDPDKSTRAALIVLKSLFDWFDDWSLALAAYNRGIYGIQRDLEFTRSTDFRLLADRQGLPRETEEYVPKLAALVLIGDNAATYGLRPPSPDPGPASETVLLPRPLDLKVAAACAGVAEPVLRELNPSVRLWVTPANDPSFPLRIPPGTKSRFEEELAKVKEWTPSPGYVRYTVQKGDILGRVAARFRTTAEAIRRENKLASPHRLRPGQVLMVRPGRGFPNTTHP